MNYSSKDTVKDKLRAKLRAKLPKKERPFRLFIYLNVLFK
jgi:hypothetical protein